MKILFLGAGGTGGYFGGRLLQVGADVTFLVRERRTAQIARDGLRIETPVESFSLPANTVTAANLAPEFDVIFLTCKAYDLASAIAAITPAMAAHTQVIPLLNGISHLALLDEAFGRARVMGGSCQIAGLLTSHGIVRQLSDTHSIVWGARELPQGPIATRLSEQFAKTVVRWKCADNIMQEMWEKVVFLATLAAMTTLMRATIGEILAAPDGRVLLRRCLNSCIEIATREGYAPRGPALARFENVLDATGSPMTASMLRDLEGGHAVEADHIVGFMRDKARQHGIDDILLASAYTHLKAYEQRRAAKRLPPPN